MNIAKAANVYFEYPNNINAQITNFTDTGSIYVDGNVTSQGNLLNTDVSANGYFLSGAPVNALSNWGFNVSGINELYFAFKGNITFNYLDSTSYYNNHSITCSNIALAQGYNGGFNWSLYGSQSRIILNSVYHNNMLPIKINCVKPK
jgi:hypothetical protein